MTTWECVVCGVVEMRLGGSWSHCGNLMREVITVPVGSREWAVVMAMRGRKPLVGDPSRSDWTAEEIARCGPTDGWRLAPPWAPKRGQAVKGYGIYAKPVYGYYKERGCKGAYLICMFSDLSDLGAWCDRVEPLEER